jgi:hypothetical protein
MATLRMTNHTRITQPLIPTGGTVTVPVFTALMLEHLFNIEQGRRKALDAWENEGGSVELTPYKNYCRSTLKTGHRSS